MANPSNAYIVANVLQDARELRDRGALSQSAFAAVTGPLNRYKALAEPYLATPGGHASPADAFPSDAARSPSVRISSAPSPAALPATAPPPFAAAASSSSSPAPTASPSARQEEQEEGGARPSVAALTARLGGLQAPSGPVSGSASASGARTPSGAVKRAAPPIPTKKLGVKETEEKGERARAKWGYQASAEDELGFSKGDLVVVVERTTEDWWKGHRVGATGSESHDRLFPANYVEVIQAPTLPARQYTGEKEKDSPPAYGAVAASSPSYSSGGYYGGGASAAAGYGSYGSAPPPSAGFGGGYGGGSQAAYGSPVAPAPTAPTSFTAPSATGTQRETDDQLKARKEKMSKMANSRVGQAAIGGAAFGAAAGIVGSIF